MRGRPVAAAVITQDGRVLLIRRRVTEGELVWSLPAGGVEPGESGEQAAVRETREETGLEVAACEVLGERLHPATGAHMTYVACEVVTGVAHIAAPDELAEVRWVSLAEAEELLPGLYGPVHRYLVEKRG